MGLLSEVCGNSWASARAASSVRLIWVVGIKQGLKIASSSEGSAPAPLIFAFMNICGRNLQI